MPAHAIAVAEEANKIVGASKEMKKLEIIRNKLAKSLITTVKKIAELQRRADISDHNCVICGSAKQDLPKSYSVRFRCLNGIDLIICDRCFAHHNSINHRASDEDKQCSTATFIAKRLAQLAIGKTNGIRQ